MRWRPILLLVVPVAIVAGAVAHARIETARATEGLVAPDAIAWTVAGRQARIEFQRSLEGEIEHFELEIRAGDTAPRRIEFTIDHDFFGGGFVGGLDVDGDDEIELVLATRAGRGASRMVEPGPAGGIIEKSFAELPDDAWQGLAIRLEQVVPPPYALVAMTLGALWFLAGLSVYVLTGLARLFARLAL
jgi:hypothetical protein